MSDETVTVEEVLAAASVRAASLAPETAGYLALSIGDAMSRRPVLIDDPGIILTMEGTVALDRRAVTSSPVTTAVALRDRLARLLAASVGAMPGLTAAARPREETDRGVEDVILDIEAALIPVNRAAGKRALARLARETRRARDAGQLELKRLQVVPQQRLPQPASEPPPPAVIQEPSLPCLIQEQSHPLVVQEMSPASGRVTAEFPPPPVETISPPPPVLSEPAPVDGNAHEPTPTILGMPHVAYDGLPSPLATEVHIETLPMPVFQPRLETTVELPPRDRTPLPEGRRCPASRTVLVPTAAPHKEPAEVTRADDLIAKFGASCVDETNLRRAAACLRNIAGLEPTPASVPVQLPFGSAPPPRATPLPPHVPHDSDYESGPMVPVRKRRAGLSWVHVSATLTALLIGVAVGSALSTQKLGPFGHSQDPQNPPQGSDVHAAGRGHPQSR